MELDEQIKQALGKAEDKEIGTYSLSDLWHYFDKRLNDPVWMIDRLSIGYNAYRLSSYIGCSVKLAQKKIQAVHHGNDQFLKVYTGFFHWSKKFLVPVFRHFLPKIQKAVSTVYDKTTTRNASIFKQVIEDMEFYDRDNNNESADAKGWIDRSISSFWFSIPRKAFYILLLKFAICLYEYDTYYRERIDFMLIQVINKREQLYFDQSSYPENWYPNRKENLTIAHFIAARKK